MGLFRVFVIFIFCIGNAWTATETPGRKQFRYHVRIPATAHSCEQEAKLLQDRFTEATQLTNAQGACKQVLDVTFDEKHYTLYSLMVTYSAEAPVTPYSAVWGTLSYSGMPSTTVGGIYDTFDQCQAAIALKKAQFEQHTELSAVSAFCEVAPYERQFLLKIDGFGIPAMKLFNQVPRTISGPELRAFLPEMIGKLGGQSVFVSGTSHFYFAKELFAIQEQAFGLMDTAEHCSLQIPEAIRIFQQAKSKHIYAVCDGSSRGLQAMGDTPHMILGDYGHGSILYYSFAECLSDKERVLNDEIAMGRSPLGAICRPDWAQRDIFILELYKAI